VLFEGSLQTAMLPTAQLSRSYACNSLLLVCWLLWTQLAICAFKSGDSELGHCGFVTCMHVFGNSAVGCIPTGKNSYA
jgi:hypothetical protein